MPFLLACALLLSAVAPAPARLAARASGARMLRQAASWQLPPALLPEPRTGSPPGAHASIGWSTFFITGYDDLGATFTGTQARYGEVAVDPAVIPLHAFVQIAGYPGIFTAEDTGALIRGYRIDIWFATLAQCYSSTGYRLARWSRNRADLW